MKHKHNNWGAIWTVGRTTQRRTSFVVFTKRMQILIYVVLRWLPCTCTSVGRKFGQFTDWCLENDTKALLGITLFLIGLNLVGKVVKFKCFAQRNANWAMLTNEPHRPAVRNADKRKGGHSAVR